MNTIIVDDASVDIVEVLTGLQSVIETDGVVNTIITTNDGVDIIVADDTDVLLVEPDVIRNIDVLTAGEQGPPGRDGSSLSSVITLTAAIPISGHRVIGSDVDGLAVYASSAAVADANLALGISIGAVAAGDTVTIQYSGTLTEPSWAWTPTLPVFCGPNGVLTQTVPASGFVLIIGVAISPTTLAIGIKQPIITA